MCLVGPLIEYSRNKCDRNCLGPLSCSLLTCGLVNDVKEYFVVLWGYRAWGRVIQIAVVLYIYYINMYCVNVLGLEMWTAETIDIGYIRHSQMHMYMDSEIAVTFFVIAVHRHLWRPQFRCRERKYIQSCNFGDCNTGMYRDVSLNTQILAHTYTHTHTREQRCLLRPNYTYIYRGIFRPLHR